jgi:hypothetical protein
MANGIRDFVKYETNKRARASVQGLAMGNKSLSVNYGTVSQDLPRFDGFSRGVDVENTQTTHKAAASIASLTSTPAITQPHATRVVHHAKVIEMIVSNTNN